MKSVLFPGILLLLLVSLPLEAQEFAWRRMVPGTTLIGVGINPLNPNSVYAEGFSASYDRGETWVTLGFPSAGDLRQILVHPSDTSVIFALGFSGGIQRSADDGLTWTTVLPDVGIDGESLCLDPEHPDTLYFGNYSDGAVYRSMDRGMTWEFRSFAGTFLCAMTVRPDSSNILFAGTGSGTISKSSDGGLSWKLVKEGGSAEIPKIVIDPDDPVVAYATAYAGDVNATGVWKTVDGGETWVLTSLTEVSTWAMDIDPTNPAILYAGSFVSSGISGVWQTADGGVSWSVIDAGLTGGSDGWSIKVHPLDPTLIWLAAGDGLYRRVPRIGAVQGAILDAATGDTLRNGTVLHVESGRVTDLEESGGTYSIGLFEGDTLMTLHIEAWPYFLHDENLAFVPDSTITQDILLTRLPRTAVSGVVQDLSTFSPVSAEIRLVTFHPVGADTLVASTDPDGAFRLDSLFISHPPIVQYGGLHVATTFPHADWAGLPVVLDTLGYDLTVLTDTADVLVTSSPAAGDYVSYFGRVLDTLDIGYHFWDYSRFSSAPVSRVQELRKSILIYFTGDDDSALPQDELDSLQAAIDSGIPVFISGQDFVEANASSGLVAQTLHLIHNGNSGANVSRGTVGSLFDGLLVFTSGGTGAGNQTSRDIVQIAGSNVFPVLAYGITGTAGTAGVRVEPQGSAGKVLVLGFGFESVSFAATAEALMETAIGYLDGSIIVGIDGGESLPSVSFGLEQNYPNPFNPVSEIRFSVAESGMTSLIVYDILGNQVAAPVHEDLPAGEYRLTFSGSRLSSGVYFYRLSSGTHVATRKMILIR